MPHAMPHNRHSVELLAGVEHRTRLNEPVMCDGGDQRLGPDETWWLEDIRVARCVGCLEVVGTYGDGGGWVRTQPHLRTDLLRP